MSEIIHLRGSGVVNDMTVSLTEMSDKVARGEVTGLIIVAVGPHTGQPVAHAVTQGDLDHLIGQMERIKFLMLQAGE